MPLLSHAAGSMEMHRRTSGRQRGVHARGHAGDHRDHRHHGGRLPTPQMFDGVDRMRLGMTARDVERELQFARLKSVSTNRPMRIRFNCPVAGQFRVVELIGTPRVPLAADGAANRCDETIYPYRPTGADSQSADPSEQRRRPAAAPAAGDIHGVSDAGVLARRQRARGRWRRQSVADADRGGRDDHGEQKRQDPKHHGERSWQNPASVTIAASRSSRHWWRRPS